MTMLSWDEVEKDETEEDFLAAKNEDGEAPVPAACPLNPDGLSTCDACQ
ncbi:Biopolymer transporter Tol (plasmid) [Pseudomonas putida]|uniref:Biopolymer transporter Tol n=1 Tax=Pseudomonas putida TaxID=303 RepID=A0A1L7NMQ1_PSEPU|nr:Biopolymer transporter Tol [Pseudomonas putida]